VTQSVLTDEDIRDRVVWRGLVFGEGKHCSVASPCINEWMNEWMNEWVNERINEWTNAVLMVKLNTNLPVSNKSGNSSHTYKNYFPTFIDKCQPSTRTLKKAVQHAWSPQYSFVLI
jgi:hypothetical protein